MNEALYWKKNAHPTAHEPGMQLRLRTLPVPRPLGAGPGVAVATPGLLLRRSQERLLKVDITTPVYQWRGWGSEESMNKWILVQHFSKVNAACYYLGCPNANCPNSIGLKNLCV